MVVIVLAQSLTGCEPQTSHSASPGPSIFSSENGSVGKNFPWTISRGKILKMRRLMLQSSHFIYNHVALNKWVNLSLSSYIKWKVIEREGGRVIITSHTHWFTSPRYDCSHATMAELNTCVAAETVWPTISKIFSF